MYARTTTNIDSLTQLTGSCVFVCVFLDAVKMHMRIPILFALVHSPELIHFASERERDGNKRLFKLLARHYLHTRTHTLFRCIKFIDNNHYINKFNVRAQRKKYVRIVLFMMHKKYKFNK